MKKRNYKRRTGHVLGFGLLVVVLLSCLLLSGCGEIQGFSAAIKKNDVAEMERIYFEDVSNGNKNQAKFQELINEYLIEMYNDMNAHDYTEAAKVSSTDAVNGYVEETWNNACNFDESNLSLSSMITNDSINNWERLGALYYSKQVYCKAIYLAEAEHNYVGAIHTLLEMIEDDSLYTTLPELMVKYADVLCEDIERELTSDISQEECRSLLTRMETICNDLAIFNSIDLTKYNVLRDKCVEVYVGFYSKVIDACKSREDYEEIIGVINADEVLSSGEAKNTSLISEAYNAFLNMVITDADKAIEKGNYAEAIELLAEYEGYFEGTEHGGKLKEKIKTVSDEFAAKYAATAENSLKNGDVDNAIACMENALKYAPDNKQYQLRAQEMEQYRPYPLYDKKNVLSKSVGYDVLYFEDTDIANDGTTVEHVVYVAGKTEIGAREEIARWDYNLEGKYDVITGTYFVPKDNLVGNLDTNIEFYGDGKKLETSPTIPTNFIKKDFCISVKNVQVLEVRVYGSSDGKTPGWLSSTRDVSCGIAKFEARKTVE